MLGRRGLEYMDAGIVAVSMCMWGSVADAERVV